MSNDAQIIRELRDRMARMESRLVSLGDGLGIDVRGIPDKPNVSLEHYANGQPYLRILSMGVKVSTLVRTCNEAGITGILVDMRRDTPGNSEKIGVILT